MIIQCTIWYQYNNIIRNDAWTLYEFIKKWPGIVSCRNNKQYYGEELAIWSVRFNWKNIIGIVYFLLFPALTHTHTLSLSRSLSPSLCFSHCGLTPTLSLSVSQYLSVSLCLSVSLHISSFICEHVCVRACL